MARMVKVYTVLFKCVERAKSDTPPIDLKLRRKKERLSL